ncbi:hypothetical protein CWATWH8502_3553 [Crocosphaera watsonii WH 8502]|uniref:Uncharacterized protein n=1 Tax=Crocosphaera watsonii WH 8502 TaxID=423474 RepID=T2IM94_CROWT|nr:hypothetical protein CWATWH8502_3553 [Crocosphaera watsonii WH 8502]
MVYRVLQPLIITPMIFNFEGLTGENINIFPVDEVKIRTHGLI